MEARFAPRFPSRSTKPTTDPNRFERSGQVRYGVHVERHNLRTRAIASKIPNQARAAPLGSGTTNRRMMPSCLFETNTSPGVFTLNRKSTREVLERPRPRRTLFTRSSRWVGSIDSSTSCISRSPDCPPSSGSWSTSRFVSARWSVA